MIPEDKEKKLIRDRPYDGPPDTDEGLRGKVLVEGLTIRDVVDCLIKAMLTSSPSRKYLQPETFINCWDYSKQPPQPTKFLLDNQNNPDFVSTKAETDTWIYEDVYRINWGNIDPLAVANNLGCEIEKMMGIYPNTRMEIEKNPNFIITNFEYYLDGGTIEIKTNKESFCIDDRLHTKTPGGLYLNYPEDDNSNLIQQDFNIIKGNLIRAIGEFRKESAEERYRIIQILNNNKNNKF